MNGIVIEATRRARHAERASERDAHLYESLAEELQAALRFNPKLVVRTPGFGKHYTVAADVFLDDYAGIGSDERLFALVKILGDAANGENVQARCSALIADLAKRHAAFHLADAIMAEEYSE